MPSTSPSSLSPGTLLAGRYRLEDHVVDAATTSYWRGVDEKLGRDVGVRTVAASDPLAATLAAAARTAASTHDPRFVRVLDVSTDRGQAFVISEWARGRTLEELLAAGPLTDRDAVHVVREVAEALASAHRQHLRHGCLRPDRVVVTDVGQVKLVGLTVDATIAGLPEINPAQAANEDAVGCGRLLFAALTGRWLGPDSVGIAPVGAMPVTALPAPPEDDGRPLSPRQVRAGVPAALDAITVRALGRPVHRQEPLLTPAAVAAALEHVEPQELSPTAEPPLDGSTPPQAVAPVTAPLPPVDAPTGSRAGGWLGWAVAAVVVVGVALLGWAIVATVSGSLSHKEPGAGAAADSSPAASRPAAGTPVPIEALRDFDPQGNGEENPETLARAIDGDPATAWTTMTYYNRANLGGLKDGVGVLVDLGSRQEFSSVSLDLVGDGTSVALRVGDTAPRSVDELTQVASRADAGTQVTLRPDSPVTARYLLVWLTRLPSAGGSDYKGGIAELVVHR